MTTQACLAWDGAVLGGASVSRNMAGSRRLRFLSAVVANANYTVKGHQSRRGHVCTEEKKKLSYTTIVRQHVKLKDTKKPKSTKHNQKSKETT